MRYLLILALGFGSVHAFAQTPPATENAPAKEDARSDEQQTADENSSGQIAQVSPVKITNPFDQPHDAMGGMMGGDMYGMEDMMDTESEMGMEMGGTGGGMGMGGMEGMMGGGYGNSDPFQAGLRRAIKALRETDSDAETKVLMNYVRMALAKRYDESIDRRRSELAQIKQRVAKLETDLKRRESAKDRVLEVQLQSVKLAAEGLMELNTP